MKILIYSQCFAPKLGGIEKVMTNIATESFNLKNEVTVITDGSKMYSSEYDLSQKFEIHRFDQIKFLRNQIKSRFAKKLFEKEKFDLIFFDTWKSLEHLEANFTKNICLVHGNEILNINKKQRILKSLSKASILVFNSNYTLKLFDKHYPEFENKKKIVIYPAFIEQKNQSKHNYKYDLCTVARLEYRKGHHLVLDALQTIKKNQNVKLKYAVLGNGPELNSLKSLTFKYSLTDQVEFFNGTTSSADIFQMSKLHIMPTITMPNSIEGFGISNVEAASFGLPCIVSNSGGTPESISDNGYIVEENNISNLSKSIFDIFNDYENFKEKSFKFASKFEKNLKISEYLNCI